MLADGDRVLVAVSGGIDSLVLCHLLRDWRLKAPIDFTLTAVHVDMGFDRESHRKVAAEMAACSLPFLVEHAPLESDGPPRPSDNSCYHCAQKRRMILFDLARRHGCNKLALGHHKDDLIETFFLNLLLSGNLSTMLPRQDLFGGRLALIRPLAFLDKEQVRTLGKLYGVRALANPCPLASSSKREWIRLMLEDLYRTFPGAKSNIFAALANPRFDYLLRH